MRFFILTLLLLAPMAAAQGPVLWFQGDGGDYSTVPTADAPTFSMLDGTHNDMETHFYIQGSNNVDADENAAAATFVYDGTVTLFGGDVTAYIARDHRGSGAISGATFAQLFDGAGNRLGPEGGIRVNDGTAYALPNGAKEEAAYVFEGIAGTFDGLKVQFTTFFADTGAPGSDFWWGSDAAPGRLALADDDIFGVPAPSAEAQTIFANLTDANATIQHAWNGTSDTFVYNWTAPEGNLSMVLNATVLAGNVTVHVTDSAGTLVANETLAENGTQMHSLVGAVTGPWNITLQYTDFNGTLGLSIEPMAPPPAMDDNTTVDPEPEANPEEESPLPLLVAVAALYVAARRKR